MHLHIDIREACRPTPAGKGVWTRGFLQELLNRPVGLTLHTDVSLPPDLQVAVGARTEPTDVLISPARHGLWHLHTARRLRTTRAEAYVSPTSFLVPALVGTRVACFPVVHDLIAFQRDEHSTRAAAIERLTLGRALATARGVLTISAATKSDILKRYRHLDPAAVTTIFAGPRLPSPPPAIRDRNIVLCIGTLCPRKNQERLVRAFGRLPESLRQHWTLVLAGGRGWKDDAILTAVRETPGTEWRAYLPDAELEDIFTHARILAFPSHYEGFGLPVLDAFQRGLPVLTSNRGSLQELAGGTAFIINPDSTNDIARGLEELMSDQVLQDDFAKRGLVRATRYSWQKSVDLALAAISAAL